MPQDRADRRGDVGGRQTRGRDLVKQRLKKVVITTVDQGHVHRSTAQSKGRTETAKATADDDDVLAWLERCCRRGRHRNGGG
jgi:hypothetical protein